MSKGKLEELSIKTMESNGKKLISILEVKLVGEVYSRLYKMENIQQVVDIVNEVMGNEVYIQIKEVKEKQR